MAVCCLFLLLCDAVSCSTAAFAVVTSHPMDTDPAHVQPVKSVYVERMCLASGAKLKWLGTC